MRPFEEIKNEFEVPIVEPIYEYLATRKGVEKIFNSRELAEKYSDQYGPFSDFKYYKRNILNNEEHIKSLDDRGTTLKYCRDLWFKELRQEFNHYTDEVFDRYYEEALRNVDDLDAIYLEMIRLELFVETVKSTI